MAKGKIELGYEVMVRATVIGIWDGSVTVQINPEQRVTLTSDSDIEPARPRPKKRKGERIL